MTTNQHHNSPSDPYWGAANRPEKAHAILLTLQELTRLEMAQSVCVDIGCGSGGISAELSPKVHHMTGIDPEPWERWMTFMQIHPNLTFVQGGYTGSNIQSCSADIVICNQVYEHVSEPQNLIRFIHDTLKPGGYAYFAGPNLLFPIEPHVFWPFIHWLPRGFAVRLMRLLGAREVVDAYSVSVWRLRRWFADFEVVNAVPYILRHPDAYGRTGLLWQLLRHVPEPALDALTFLSPGFIFILRKPLMADATRSTN